LLAALKDRHLRGGKNEQEATRHIEFSDRANLDLVLDCSQPADIRVEKSDSRTILRVVYPDSTC
jgi:hypothetical protein